MKITCESCQSKYTVSDEKVQGKTVKIKCRKCGATILVGANGATTNGAGGPADPVSAASTSGDGPSSFTLNVGENDQRTMTLAEVVEAYNSQVVTAETYVWADGMSDWMPLGQVDSIVAALNAGAAPVPSAPPPAAVPSQPPHMGGFAAAPQAYAAPTPSPATPAASPYAAAAEPAQRTAARREPGRRSQDLFGGGFSGQGATEEVATSAPLFSGGAMPPASSSGKQPGQREENSVLFSLSALTAKAGAPSMSVGATTASKEDSGLIDLKALSAGAAPTASSDLMPDHAALFPLGMPAVAPSVAPPMMMGTEAPPAKNRTPIFIAIGAVVALCAIVGAFFVAKGGGEKAPVAAATEAVVAPPPPAPTVEAIAAPTAEASAAPTASASAVAVGPKVGPRPGGGGKAPPPGAAAPAKGGSGGAPTPPPAAAKGKGNCGCAAGDLMCAMKCSAGN